MATSVSSVSLKDILCSDPVDGVVYKHLFNGGSWFEAEQMHWRIRHKHLLAEITTLTTMKPTKNHAEKAKSLLVYLKDTSTQLVPDTEYLPIHAKAETMVSSWMAPLTKPVVKSKGFAALAETDSEEE
jgi:hypothetical protein